MEEFLIGNIGSEKILTSLSTTTYPLQFINQFQQENGISKKSLPSVSPVLNLLDLHQIPRGDLYLNLLTSLKKDLLLKINILNKQELEKLLEQTFPYIGFEELQDIPMNVMKRLSPEVPTAFLLKLAEAGELYEQCPIEVKRLIWMVNEELFREKIQPLIVQYIEDPVLNQEMNELLLTSSTHLIDPIFAVSHLPSKRRENNIILQEIVDLFGRSNELYQMFINQIKRVFSETGNWLLCNLRAEILMTVHDQSISEIYNHDQSHNIAWCLDACIRDNIIDARRIKEIQTNLNNQNSNVMGDTAMVFANPIAVNCIIKNILIQLKEVVKRKQIPKDDESIKFLTYLLVLALKSHEIIKETKYKIPHVKKHILQTFYPILASQILDDITRDANYQASNTSASNQNIPVTASNSSVTPISNVPNSSSISSSSSTLPPVTTLPSASSSPLLDSTSLISPSEFQDLETCFLKYEVCKKITLSYIINRVLDRDIFTVDRYLKFIFKMICKDNNIIEPNVIVQSPTVSSSDDGNTNTPSTTTSTTTTTTDDTTYENLINVDIYKYFGNDFIQSLVSQVLQIKELKFNSVIIDSFLFKFRFLPFIQKQLIRYLLENHSRMSQREFIQFIQKLFNSVLSTYKLQMKQEQTSSLLNKRLLDDIVHSTRLLIDKTGQRFNEKMAPALFEFYKSNQKQFTSPLTTQQHQHSSGVNQHNQQHNQQPIQKLVSPTLSSSELGTPNSSTTTSAPVSTESPMDYSTNNNNNNNSMDTTSDSGWD